MNNEPKTNKQDDLIKIFKKQFKVQVILNLFNTILILIFMVIFYKNKSILIFLLILIGVLWLYIGLKLLYLRKAIKKMEEEKAKEDEI